MRDRPRERDIVFTGAAVSCRLGDDLGAIGAQLRAGISPPFTRWPPAIEYGARGQVVAVVDTPLDSAALGLPKERTRFMGRAARLAYLVARRALDAAKMTRDDFAIVVGSGVGDSDAHGEIERKLVETHSARRASPTSVPRLMSSTVSANLVNTLHTTGPSFGVAAACAAGAYNIIVAAELIAAGHVDAAIAGGVDVADLHFLAAFDAMRACNTIDNETPARASRPYAADRAGFVFGDGAGIVVLETRASAEARGVEILGVLRGCGMSSDGTGEMVAPSSVAAEQAMRRALAHAGVTAAEIDYVNTHGTSTPVGDIAEVRALRRVFDERKVAYSSTKGYTGHAISGAGAMEAVFTLLMLRDGYLSPSVNATPLDPELVDWPPVLEPTNARIQLAMSNSFGFGGTNAVLILGAP